MKKMTLRGIIALTFVAFVLVSNPAPLLAATEVAAPDLPSDFSDAAKWPFTHTESCMPAGKEYRTTAYARITNDKKVESVVKTSFDGTIFCYVYEKIGQQQDFSFRFIKTEKGWLQFDRGTKTYEDSFEMYLLKKGGYR